MATAEGPEAPVGGGVVVVDDLLACTPPELFVLTVLEAEGGGLELRETGRGEAMVVTFTTMERLVAECGAGQPWTCLATAELERVADAGQVSLVAIDTSIPEGHRYPESDLAEQPNLDETAESATDRLVYVPSRPARQGQGVVLELQPHEGRSTLLIYDSLEELRARCGPYQSCVSLRVDRLEEAASRSGAEAVLFNPVLSEQSRHTGPVLDWRQHRRNQRTG